MLFPLACICEIHAEISSSGEELFCKVPRSRSGPGRDHHEAKRSGSFRLPHCSKVRNHLEMSPPSEERLPWRDSIFRGGVRVLITGPHRLERTVTFTLGGTEDVGRVAMIGDTIEIGHETGKTDGGGSFRPWPAPALRIRGNPAPARHSPESGSLNMTGAGSPECAGRRYRSRNISVVRRAK